VKEKPGRATGGFVKLGDIDQIERGGQFTLKLCTNPGTWELPAMRLELEFADKKACKRFCKALVKRVPAYWVKQAETAPFLLSTGVFDGPQNEKPRERLSRLEALDSDKIKAEIGKLSSIDWDDESGELSISMSEAGCPIQ